MRRRIAHGRNWFVWLRPTRAAGARNPRPTSAMRFDVQLRTTARRSGQIAPPWKGSDDRWTVALWPLAGAISIWGVMSLIGLLLTNIIDRGSVHAADLGVNQWFAQHRTSFWNDTTAFGTGLAETITVVVVTAVLAAILRADLPRHALSQRRPRRADARRPVAIVGGEHIPSATPVGASCRRTASRTVGEPPPPELSSRLGGCQDSGQGAARHDVAVQPGVVYCSARDER